MAAMGAVQPRRPKTRNDISKTKMAGPVCFRSVEYAVIVKLDLMKLLGQNATAKRVVGVQGKLVWHRR